MTLIVVKASTVVGLVLFSALILFSRPILGCADCADYEDGADLTVAEIVKLRGFIAEQHYVTTTDGYILSLVRILNPLINKGKRGSCYRSPILFVHGSYTTGAAFLGNSLEVRPKDYTELDIGELDEANLSKLLEIDPVSRSLPFLASCFGHESWILDRRGTWESLGHRRFTAYKRPGIIGDTGAKCFSNENLPENALRDTMRHYQKNSIDYRYWNYSLDEQVAYDLPETIELILSKTESDQIAYVGHSSGASLGLMLLSSKPDYADKISTLIALSPNLYNGHAKSFHKDLRSYAIGKVLRIYRGPIDDSEYVAPQVECLINQTCQKEFGSKRCKISKKQQCLTAGKLTGNDPKIIPIASSFSTPVGSRECLQIVQAHYKKKMHFFDHDSTGKNRIKHCNYKAPLYDVKQIKLKSISIFYGSKDTQATPEDVRALIKDLPASTEGYFFDEGLCFNHYSTLYHLKVNTLVNIPALRAIN